VRWCGRSDPPLTAAGRDAAARVAQEVAADHGIGSPPGALVLASPFRRSTETAAAIAAALGVHVQVDPGIAEIDFGDIDGLTWDDVLASHPGPAAAILDGADLDWPAGETAAQVDARARAAAERIRVLGRSSAVVVVSHGGFIAVLARYLGVPSAAGGLAPASLIRVDVSPIAAVDIVASTPP
jgi:broad specificity phosphatase PhoE